MKKSKKIILLIVAILIIIGITFIIIYKPTYELNKAVEYLKNGKYKEAYEYIESKVNEENKTIIKELITQSFCNRIAGGMEKCYSITMDCVSVINKVEKGNVDYTLDDNINISIKALDTYINLENEISKDMILDELSETYDLYFKQIKYIRENFYDILNHIDDENFITDVENLAGDMMIVSNELTSVSDNYNYNPKSLDIYENISKYIIN